MRIPKARWGRRVAVALLSGALASTLFTVTPAQAVPVACAPHNTVASYTTAGGNYYQMQIHICGDEDLSNSAARAHWHCYRNGVSWDGCRLNTDLLVQYFDAGAWHDSFNTRVAVSNPGGGYSCTADSGDNNLGFFDDSTTNVSNTFQFPTGWLLRAAAKDPDNARFCLADGTTVLRDVTNSVSQTWNP